MWPGVGPFLSIVLQERVTSRRPSGVNRAASTDSSCAKLASSWTDSRSQTRAVRSSEPVTAVRPSGETCRHVTAPEWPSKVRIS